MTGGPLRRSYLLVLGATMAVGVSCLRPRNASEAVAIPGARVTALLGCYRLLEQDGQLIESAAYNLSNRIRLDAVRRVDSLNYPGAKRRRQLARRSPRLSPPPRADDTEELSPSWEIIPTGDTLELSFHNGYSGAILRLAAPDGRADTLRGVIAQFWDFPPYMTSKRGAMAARESCEAVPTPDGHAQDLRGASDATRDSAATALTLQVIRSYLREEIALATSRTDSAPWRIIVPDGPPRMSWPAVRNDLMRDLRAREETDSDTLLHTVTVVEVRQSRDSLWIEFEIGRQRRHGSYCGGFHADHLIVYSWTDLRRAAWARPFQHTDTRGCETRRSPRRGLA